MNVVAIEYDLGYLRRAIPELETYLLSKVVQWPLGCAEGLPFSSLTVEGFLLSRQRLTNRELSPGDRTEVQHLEQTYQAIVHRWRHAWGGKASQGFQHRLTLWQSYLDELIEEPGEHAGRYVHEVRLRAMLALLHPYLDNVRPENFGQLARLDQKLHNIFHPAGFIWPPELEPAFPAPAFWYLYGLPMQNKANYEDFDC